MLTQYDWLLPRLEPLEAVELTFAKDSFLARGLDEIASCPLFWLEEEAARDSSVSGHLFNGFVWHESPQGKQYWTAVYEKYAAKEKESNQ